MEGISEDDRFNPRDNTKSKKKELPTAVCSYKELGYCLGGGETL